MKGGRESMMHCWMTFLGWYSVCFHKLGYVFLFPMLQKHLLLAKGQDEEEKGEEPWLRR